MIHQTNIEQTGVVIFRMNSTDEEKQIPLFSLNPLEEADEISEYIDGKKIHVFVTNNLLDYNIMSVIEKYENEHNGVIPEEYVDQLASGFSFVEGYEKRTRMMCYL